MTVWAVVLVTALLCYLLKLLGWLVPARVFDDVRIRRAMALLPVALLAALVVVQTFAADRALSLDARAAGLVAGAIALALRAPFLVLVAVAAATAAVVRALG